MAFTKLLSILIGVFLFLGLITGSTLAMLLPNSPPSLSIVEDPEINENETLVIPVSASDPDGDSLALTVDVLPEGASFMDNGDNTGTFTWTPNFDQAGEYPVTFMATDPQGAADEMPITMTVSNTNRVPTLLAPLDQEVEAGQEISFSLVASDPDGDSLIFVVQGLPEQAQFDSATLRFEWTPSNQDVGMHTITFEVSDGQLSVSEEVIITVTAPPQNNNSTPISSEEQELLDLQDEFEVLEDDFSSYKRSYERALQRDDEEDIEEYEDKLENLDEDLEDLLPEVEELSDDIDDNDDLDNQNALEEDAEDLYDDIQELRHDIDVLLHGEEDEAVSDYEESEVVLLPSATRPGTRVIVEPITIPPAVVPVLGEESPSQWEELRPLVWIGAGITIVIAVIIFLLALLLL